MCCQKSSPKPWLRLAACGLAGAVSMSLSAATEPSIILHLKDGSRLAGAITSETSSNVVLTTSWAGSLTLPASAIENRETPGSKSKSPAPKKNDPKPPAKKIKGTVRFGSDFAYGARDRDLFYGRLKLSYDQPYVREPEKHMRSALDLTVDYGRTDGIESVNRADASGKTDLDFSKRMFVYGLATGGYDYVRKIDSRFSMGSGAGVKVFTLPVFTMNAEGGLDYQVQDRANEEYVETFHLRLAQDFRWKMQERLTLTSAMEFAPQLLDVGEYRARLEGNLSYGLTDNLSLNFTVLNLYDTQPARNVAKNELQIRSSLGVTF